MQKMPKWWTDGRDGCNRLVKSVDSHPVHTGRKGQQNQVNTHP